MTNRENIRHPLEDRPHSFEGLASSVEAVGNFAAEIGRSIGPAGLGRAISSPDGAVAVCDDAASLATAIAPEHPAARIIADAAIAHDRIHGDGAATAVVIAAALLEQALQHVLKGQLPTTVAAAIDPAVAAATDFIAKAARPVAGSDDPTIQHVSDTAAGDQQVADVVAHAARIATLERIADDERFSLADNVIAVEGAETRAAEGITLPYSPINLQMPSSAQPAEILILQGDLAPERLPEAALATEPGFTRQQQLLDGFHEQIRKLPALRVNCLIVSGTVAPWAEELLNDMNVMTIAGVSHAHIARLATSVGADVMKTSGMRRNIGELRRCMGTAERVECDRVNDLLFVEGGAASPAATVIIGAVTPQVLDIRVRRAKKAAASVHSAIRHGVVPGAGAVELAAVMHLQVIARSANDYGLTNVGFECLAEALKAPHTHILANCGRTDPQLIVHIIERHAQQPGMWAVDCDTGEIEDMSHGSVIDAARIRISALRTAAEVAKAVLCVDTVTSTRRDDT